MSSPKNANDDQGRDTARRAARALRGRPLVVVSNRLPVERRPEGGWASSAGGLVTALSPILAATGGRWIGWDGGEGKPRGGGRVPDLPFELAPVPLTRGEIADFYYGFSNRTLWPLLHDLSRPPVFEERWFAAYEAVNRKYARAVLEATGPRDAIWVHDYHLLLVPGMIRQERKNALILFFLHVPFPPPEIWRRLPWRDEIACGMLGADLAGFHTEAYAENFRRAALASARGVGWSAEGDLLHEGRSARVAAFPISVDFRSWDALARSPEVLREVERLRGRLGGRKLILGVDRLDYTKGIPERLRAFERLLEEKAHLRRSVVLIQIAVPSRTRVREYRALKREVEENVGRINGRFTDAETERIPVHYLYRSIPRQRVAALYRAADVALVTPLKDGMNLVAKEYCSCRSDEQGVLVLSEFAGASRELGKGALLVNPFDPGATVRALEQALEMGEDEARARMRRLRARVAASDVFRWAEDILESGCALFEPRRRVA